jgi:hypothetical protein
MLNALQAERPAGVPAHETLHVVVLTAFNTRAALLAVDGALAASGARLCGLSLKPLGEMVEGILRVQGVDDGGAEILCEDIVAGLGVRSARLEHQWPLRQAG